MFEKVSRVMRPQLSRGALATKVLRVVSANPTQFAAAEMYFKRGITLPQATELLRRAYVAAALKDARYNRCEAARISGLHRNTINRIIAGIPVPQLESGMDAQCGTGMGRRFYGSGKGTGDVQEQTSRV